MLKYLKKFQAHSNYETFIASSDYITPNVSLCVQQNEVHYNPLSLTPIIDGHEYVDLGLPSGTKWATMNVGANSETDYGNYYQYGAGAAQYATTNGENFFYTGTENPLATSADTVAQVWGGQWHMPTKTQFEELTANTTYEWITINGVNGVKFTAQNGNYVFFAFGGNWIYGNQDGVGTGGSYWSSTPYNSNSAYLLSLLSFNGNRILIDDEYRDFGCSVRGVVG